MYFLLILNPAGGSKQTSFLTLQGILQDIIITFQPNIFLATAGGSYPAGPYPNPAG